MVRVKRLLAVWEQSLWQSSCGHFEFEKGKEEREGGVVIVIVVVVREGCDCENWDEGDGGERLKLWCEHGHCFCFVFWVLDVSIRALHIGICIGLVGCVWFF